MYWIDFSPFVKCGDSSISDHRLAAKIHTHGNDSTTLSTYLKNDREFDLRLCGFPHVNKFDAEGKFDSRLTADDFSDEIIAELEAGKTEFTLDDGTYYLDGSPWFEWIDDQGDPVVECFGELPVQYKAAVDLLLDTLDA